MASGRVVRVGWVRGVSRLWILGVGVWGWREGGGYRRRDEGLRD